MLARVDPLLLQSTLDRENATLAVQKAELARIEALLEQADKSEKRAVILQKSNKDYISDQEMDQLHFATLGLVAQKKLAKANIDAQDASVKYAKRNLTWPRSCRPSMASSSSESRARQTLASAFQTPELFIIALTSIYARYASVDEADIARSSTLRSKNAR